MSALSRPRSLDRVNVCGSPLDIGAKPLYPVRMLVDNRFDTGHFDNSSAESKETGFSRQAEFRIEYQ